jgi:hypothetical protein
MSKPWAAESALASSPLPSPRMLEFDIEVDDADADVTAQGLEAAIKCVYEGCSGRRRPSSHGCPPSLHSTALAYSLSPRKIQRAFSCCRVDSRRFLYGQMPVITHDNVRALLITGSFFDIPALCGLVSDYVFG